MKGAGCLVGCLALLAIGCGSGGDSPTTTTVVVSHVDRGDWVAFYDNCAGGTLTGGQGFGDTGMGTPPLGTGFYRFHVGSDPEAWPYFANPRLDGVRLDAITALSYDVYVHRFGGEHGLAPVLELWVDVNGDSVVDELLTYDPRNNVSDTGLVVERVWQRWDALAGTWCDSANACGGLLGYASTFPNARVIPVGGEPGFDVSVGCGVANWAWHESAIDRVVIGVNGQTTIFDFEFGL